MAHVRLSGKGLFCPDIFQISNMLYMRGGDKKKRRDAWKRCSENSLLLTCVVAGEIISYRLYLCHFKSNQITFQTENSLGEGAGEPITG